MTLKDEHDVEYENFCWLVPALKVTSLEVLPSIVRLKGAEPLEILYSLPTSQEDIDEEKQRQLLVLSPEVREKDIF